MTSIDRRRTMTGAIKEAVREKYSQAALRAGGSCCGAGERAGTSPITANLYGDHETGELPEAAVLASLGCGNPTALAELKSGETVLDLGSGGGIDVLLSAASRRPHREGLWSRYDRRNAGAGARKSTKSRG